VNVHVAADERDGDVTFLRTVREGPTDRSYGVHVADLAGVPSPVVERSREVLDRLREDEAIEARGSGAPTEANGGGQQVVFDLDDGRLRAADDASGVGGDGAASDDVDGGVDSDGGADGDADGADATLSPAEREVLEALSDVEVAETTPIELLSRVQEWQSRLDEE